MWPSPGRGSAGHADCATASQLAGRHGQSRNLSAARL